MPSDGSSFLFQGIRRSIPVDRPRLRRFAARLREEVADGRNFTVLVSNDSELQRLNAEFLDHDYPTDVLSFPSLEEEDGLGEMAISADRAQEQSAEFGYDVNTEIEILMLHGVLHLLGHDHEKDRGRMKRLEKKWRTALGLPAGLIERTKP